jgi:hypothetical protein
MPENLLGQRSRLSRNKLEVKVNYLADIIWLQGKVCSLKGAVFSITGAGSCSQYGLNRLVGGVGTGNSC